MQGKVRGKEWEGKQNGHDSKQGICIEEGEKRGSKRGEGRSGSHVLDLELLQHQWCVTPKATNAAKTTPY